MHWVDYINVQIQPFTTICLRQQEKIIVFLTMIGSMHTTKTKPKNKQQNKERQKKHRTIQPHFIFLSLSIW